MEIGVLASILGKDAAELQSALKIEEGITEIPVDVYTKAINTHITNIEKGSLSRGKEQGKGWAEKEVKQDIEKRFQSIGIEGENIDSYFENLTNTLSKTKKGVDVNEKLKKDFDILTAKYNDATAQLEQIQLSNKKNKEIAFINSKLDPILKQFGDSDKVKNLVKNDFVNSIKYSISENDIDLLDENDKMLKQNGNYVSFEDYATNFLSEYLTPVSGEKRKPDVPKNDGGGSKYKPKGQTMDELIRELRSAPDAEKRAAINEKIKELEKKN